MIHSLRNQKWIAIILLTIFFSGILVLAPSQTNAQGNRIPAEELKEISRLSFTLRDAYQTQYTIFIFAQDEESSTLTEEDFWTNNNPGNPTYTGTYRAALLKKGDSYGTVQSADLGLHSVTLPQTWHYTIKSKDKLTPDMLLITEWGSSNFNLAKPFIIRSGVLQPLKFVDNKGKKIDDFYPAGRGNGIRMLSDARVQFKFYNNTVFKYEIETFKLNISKLELRLSDTRYVNFDQPNWPNSGIGDRAYLESLKTSAVKGILPNQPNIKLGMTHKSMLNTLKKAKFKENGEWGAYYVYSQYAIGFDSYLHELDNRSRIMVFNLFAEQRNLYPETVKLWLGKPQKEYLNEAEGGYDMIYKYGSRTLSFHYPEEDEQIYLITIY
ncbi:hypothetical protein [Paenibacillus taichungensis]|uniref:hypothetical protein n=1 Tax=Paenibacillus taichungensis TaxID=484184 RepID=UPI00287246B2|nr:hypothetical protein [Paenibacillus taichungensis]MDR9749527.1 hypothetical protein [Paenibacillus taichungensis]